MAPKRIRRSGPIAGLTLALLLLAAAGGPAAAKPYLSADNVPMAAGYRSDIVVGGLAHPWGMAWLPDGTLLVTERPGRLRLVRENGLAPEPVSGLPEIFVSGQAGLLDVAVDPDFEANRWIYLSHAHGQRSENRLRVIRARLENGALKEVVTLCETLQAKSGTQHFGSRLLWLPDKTLLVSVGDGGNPPIRLEGDWIRKQAQNRASRLGKILRLNRDGSAPPDNPFAGDATADPLVWSYGHRNVQGLARDPDSDRVWASEHGALGGDELNQIRRGGNYGWPEATYSREYFGPRISDQRSLPRMIDPVLVWQVAIAPGGLVFYTGERFPGWRGNLFAAGLVSQDVRRLVLSAEGRVIQEEAIRIGARVRHVAQGPDGLLYVLTDEAAGRLIRILPADAADQETAP
jgi:glucose/arabinose dehydrogenase